MSFHKWRWPAGLVILIFFCAAYQVAGSVADLARRSALSLQITPIISHGGLKLLLLALFLALTALFGRVYCSLLCPAGLVQELFLRLGRRLGFAKLGFISVGPFILIPIALVVFSLPVVINNFDPIGLFGRLAVWYPGVTTEGGYLSAIYVLGIVALVLVPLFRGRWFCISFCPVGLLLGLASDTGGRRIVINAEKCISCGKCEKVCQTRCADAKNKTIHSTRCVLCLDCLNACGVSAIEYVPTRPQERRTFFRSASGLLAGGLFVFSRKIWERIDPWSMDARQNIAPPGTRSHARHQMGCITCQACVPACPVGIIQPNRAEKRPVLDYNLGFCQYSCVACTKSCPAGVLNPLSVEEKQHTRIAKTEFHLERCVVVTQGTSCGACAEVCPTHAVTMVEQADPALPTRPDFAAEYCIGCGGCYHVCPSEPRSFTITGIARQESTPGVRPVSEPAKPEAGHGEKAVDGNVTEFPF